MVFMYKGILFSLKKEGNSDIYHNMDEHSSEMKQSQTDKYYTVELIYFK